MALQSTGKISLSDIQTLFGGTNPITMSEYYNNNASGFTTGVTGIPNSGATISISHFYGKAKPAVSTGSLLNTTLQNIYSGLQPYLAEYKNANFYEYTLDGTSEYIGDGTYDMYDNGNYTQIMADGAVSGNLSYSTTTETSVVVNAKSTGYISLGHARPVIMLAKSTTRASWGFRKTGNLGADGGGSYTNFNVYTGSTVSGFTVYAWCRHVYNAGDPSIADLYFAIGDSSSTFYTSTMTVNDPNNTDNGLSSMNIDCVNVLFGCMLCSKPSGTSISAMECQTVLTSLINRLSPIIQTSAPVPPTAPTGGTGGTGGTGDLYTFSTHTFTNAGATGINGPILSQVQSSYSTATWAQNTSFLNMSIQGIQLWTVPTTGSYRIRTMGASAGRTPSFTGGRGVIIQADVALNKGDVIKILVGQGGTGKSDDCNTGAGGGTFVTFNDNTIILIAGGGGAFGNGIDAVTTRNGGSATNGSAGGTNGSGGVANQGPSGAGYSGNGAAAQWGSLGGVNNGIAQSFLNGGQGGSSVQQNPNVLGGFGGGASGHGNCCIGGGGGGGYSGGGGATSCTGGGGGGSFIITTGTNVQTSTGTYDGSGSFNGSAITNLNVWNTYGTATSGVFAPSGSVTITKI